MASVGWFWCEPIEPKLKKARKKKSKNTSLYRESKIAVHETVGGIGIVGRLAKKEKE